MTTLDESKREYTLDDLHNDVQPRGARLPLLHKPADYDDLPYLSDTEKSVIGENLLSTLEEFGSEATLPDAALLNDPASRLAYHSYYCTLKQLLDEAYLDAQIRGPVLDLMYFNVMRDRRSEFGTHTYIENYAPRDTFDVRKIVMIDFPDCEIYSPEERLAIIFSKAVLENTMTDEIFNEAVERWGVKMTLRYLHFICYYWSGVTFANTLGITGAYNGIPEEYVHSPASRDAFRKNARETRELLIELENARANRP